MLAAHGGCALPALQASACVAMQVSVRILGGLMALGYEIGSILKRTSAVFSDGQICVKLDSIEGMKQSFVQVTPHHSASIVCGSVMLQLDRSCNTQTHARAWGLSLSCFSVLPWMLMIDGADRRSTNATAGPGEGPRTSRQHRSTAWS